MAVYITLEGVDGSGKSTQLQLLIEHLQTKGIPFVYTREPGGTIPGIKIREILLDGEEIHPLTETFLFAADRTEHMRRIIQPALENGINVISDRGADSNMVYQGWVGGVRPEFLGLINRYALNDRLPDRTIVLDLPAEVSKKRIQAHNRLDEKPLDYHEAVRAGYHQLCDANPERIKLIDASGAIEEVHQEILNLVLPLMK